MRSLLWVVPVLAGCSTYAKHRAALVPHATPIPGDGQPLESAGELTVGADNLVDLAAPGVGDPNAGDVVPKHQLRGQAQIRVAKNFSFGALWAHGVTRDATAISPTAPPLEDGSLDGPGIMMAYSIDTGTPGLRIGLATEVVFWNVPWVEYTSCVQDCLAGPYTYSERGERIVPTLGLAIVPSYRRGHFTYFGGVTARNHPTIREKLITTDPSSGDVDPGPENLTVHAGLGVELGAGIRASLIVHQTVSTDPVAYGPGVGLLVTVPLGRDVDRAPPPAAPQYGPPGSTL